MGVRRFEGRLKKACNDERDRTSPEWRKIGKNGAMCGKIIEVSASGREEVNRGGAWARMGEGAR